MNVPPLPPGWTQHTAPTGHVYYFHTATNQSSYVRPMPTFANVNAASAASAAPKKDKPLVKTPIPDTDWIRVKTVQGNVFYNNKATKASVWVIPEEIREEVQALEAEEAAAERQKQLDAEAARSKGEAAPKRKADTVAGAGAAAKKKLKTGSGDEEDGSEESEEEDWQREAAAQLAAEAEAMEKLKREEKEMLAESARQAEREMAEKAAKLNLPRREDLSIEEAKALFKTLLQEKSINPLLPWDVSLPQFVSDPRYGMLTSVATRRDVFDEYCRDRARELREQAVKEQRETADPKEAFERLLKDEVKSTRTSWTEWRRTWKKDRRFYGWGRDDREREKRFREFLKDLGERKRAEAQKAEAGFLTLLRENAYAMREGPWKSVKGKIAKDPRYDAVGSSSLREELYNTFIKAQDSVAPPAQMDAVDNDASAQEDKMTKQERRERAVRDREAQVHVERRKVEADIDRSKLNLNREEGEALFRSMLTDAIRDPQTTWDDAVSQLQIDPRFTSSPLPANQQAYLFNEHIAQLRAKHLEGLHALFASRAPSLATTFNELPLSSLLASLPVTKLGFDERSLQDEYTRWNRERQTAARKAFDEMLSENSFVDFWGRLGKIGGEGVNGGVKAEEEGEEDEGEGGGGKADMKALAKSIDLHEMQKVLTYDGRYTVFDHVPEVREQWLRDYIAQLGAPKLSVHLA